MPEPAKPPLAPRRQLDPRLLGALALAGVGCLLVALTGGPVRIADVALPGAKDPRLRAALAGFGFLLAAWSSAEWFRPGWMIAKIRRWIARAGWASARMSPPLPRLSPRFCGRKTLLDEMRQHLTTDHAVVLTGMGGVGKTQLALAYLDRHRNRYKHTWWLHAERTATLAASYAALATDMGLVEVAGQTQPEAIHAVRRWLSQHDRWLLVFDNAEDPRVLEKYLPDGSRGHILVTSQNHQWPELRVLRVGPWSRAESLEFLRLTGRIDKTAAELAEALGDLPLALEQAVAYMGGRITPAEYRALLEDRAKELFAEGIPASYPQRVATTWAVALGRIRHVDGAEGLLRLSAFLAPEQIPRAMLRQQAVVLPAPLADVLRNPIAENRAIGELDQYSLIAATPTTLSVHRLVQAVVRHQLNPDDQHRWATTALTVVQAAFPTKYSDPEAWPRYAQLLPHVLAVTEHAEKLGLDPTITAGLMNEAGLYVWQRADLEQARRLFDRSRAIIEGQFGPDHLGTAITFSNLANVLRAQGDLERARMLHEHALAIYQARLSPDHPDIAISLNNLANVLYDQDDLDGARIRYERALDIQRAQRKDEDLDTANTINNLANALYGQRNFEAARTLHERALAIHEHLLGPEHPYTADSLNNLANVLCDQGDLDGARTRYERAFAVHAARLGSDHPDTATSLSNLAVVLALLGDLDRAQVLSERALTTRERRLGPDHPDTVAIMRNLAEVLRDQGSFSRTSILHERMLTMQLAP